jgi:hypothetical protein
MSDAVTVEIINQLAAVEVVGPASDLDVVAPASPEVIIATMGVKGNAGADGLGAAVHEEGFNDLDIWVVNHNFGRKPTAVQVLSPGGVELMADVVHISNNQLRVLFVQPYTGQVRVM